MASSFHVNILKYNHPEDFTFQLANLKQGPKSGRIRNIVPIEVRDGTEEKLKKWPELTTALVFNLISMARELIFVPIEKTHNLETGSLFFVDYNKQIIEIKVRFFRSFFIVLD